MEGFSILSPPRQSSTAPPCSPLKWTPTVQPTPSLDLPFGENLRRSFARTKSETNVASTKFHMDIDLGTSPPPWPQGNKWQEPQSRAYVLDVAKLHSSFLDTPINMEQSPEQPRSRKRSNQDTVMEDMGMDIMFSSSNTLIDYEMLPITMSSTSSTCTLASPSQSQGSLPSFSSLDQVFQDRSLKRVRSDRPRSNSMPSVARAIFHS